MMRRLCACLAALTLLTAGAALAATAEYDLTAMTLPELYALREQLDARIDALER